MKKETLHTLITARVLLDQAVQLSDSDERHLCTAAIIVLQDSFELILIAFLKELGVDDEKSIESMSFDELLSELRKRGVPILKSGTLKAMNKHRVVCKHYGQIAEGITVRNFVEAAVLSVNAMSQSIIGKRLEEIYITELLDEGESRELLNSAAALIDRGEFLSALTEIRKSIFLEIESDYSIFDWENPEAEIDSGKIFALMRSKAPSYCRNKGWIQANVKEPLDYIKVDAEMLRLDSMEWGVNTSDINNIRRLTPEVFRSGPAAPWHVRYNVSFPLNMATKSNAHFCLDRAVAILIKKQQHKRAHKRPLRRPASADPIIFVGDKLYSKASTESRIIRIAERLDRLTAVDVVSGFDSTETYYVVSGYVKLEHYYSEHLVGYVLIEQRDLAGLVPIEDEFADL